MIWLDRTNKKCLTVEDIDWIGETVSANATMHNEVINHFRHPVGIVNSYKRDMHYENKEGICGGRMFCVAFGLEKTRGKSGWRSTIINSIN